MRKKILQVLYVVLLVSVAALAAMGMVVYSNMKTMSARSESVLHAQQVLFNTERAISILKDAETGQRGFIITRDSSYLQPYFLAIDSIDPCLNRLRDLVNDNPLQLSRVDTIWELANQRFQILNMALKISLINDDPGSLHWQMRSGKVVMDQARAVAKRMKNTEQMLYRERTKDYDIMSATTLNRLSVLSIAAVIFFMGAFYFILRELQQRWHYQSELEKTIAQLSSSNAELENFNYISSHHLQEPLRKLQMFSNRLSSKYLVELQEEAQYLVQRIYSSAKQAQALLDDLITFMELGKQPEVGSFRPILLRGLIQNILENELAATIREKNAVIDVGEEIQAVPGDAKQLRKLFVNLLDNSLKFSKLTGEIKVTVIFGVKKTKGTLILPLAREVHQCACITITDNGVGFESQFHEKAFQLFQRMHLRSEYEGTGVGLAICRKIVLNHHGNISIQSELDAGTEVLIHLPL